MPGGGSTTKGPGAQLLLTCYYSRTQQDRSGLDAGRRLDLEGAGRHGAHLVDRLGERGAHQLVGLGLGLAGLGLGLGLGLARTSWFSR